MLQAQSHESGDGKPNGHGLAYGVLAYVVKSTIKTLEGEKWSYIKSTALKKPTGPICYAVEFFFRRDAEKHKPLHKDDTQKQLWLPLLPWVKVTKICGGQCAALAGEVRKV